MNKEDLSVQIDLKAGRSRDFFGGFLKYQLDDIMKAISCFEKRNKALFNHSISSISALLWNKPFELFKPPWGVDKIKQPSPYEKARIRYLLNTVK